MVFVARLCLCHQQTSVSSLPTLPEWDLLCGFWPLTLLPSFPVITFSPVPCLYDLFHNKLQSCTNNLQLKVFRATETSSFTFHTSFSPQALAVQASLALVCREVQAQLFPPAESSCAAVRGHVSLAPCVLCLASTEKFCPQSAKHSEIITNKT